MHNVIYKKIGMSEEEEKEIEELFETMITENFPQ